jgi:hypothetical protein
MTGTAGTYSSIANEGGGDLEIPINSEKHSGNIRGDNSSEKLTKHFVKSNSKIDESLSAAEGTLALHAVVQWGTEGGLGAHNPPPPKFRSFDKAKPNLNSVEYTSVTT